jgi:hypothetical protein
VNQPKAIVATLVLGGMLAVTHSAAAQAHLHMGHVADAFGNTPDNQGLLPTAQAEAGVAAQHAELALSNRSDLGSIKRHVAHVAYAVDPSTAESGPGAGYGLLVAAQGVSRHIELAAASDDASDNVKTHAAHVQTSATNVVGWAESVLELAEEVQGASSAGEAAELAEQILQLTVAIVSGQDANGDGRISWGEGEGGLEQAAFHMDLMKKGEGQ